ncbi:mitogen-activated protein kinase-binding protein 1-like isoform X2 [Triplophysa dalaica]|uniref:mitogen-activated protein kinase-binding protein 1-like isoform X2 n=1 Tax=Triplophysa dalaica TaxID=1582913 RepID=UPI0024DF6997|nr:mitogen-activated protein kinase-binding protein 1-like isoform X2 [Triplophysa dalaica]
MDGSIRTRIKSLLRSPSIRLRKSRSRVSLSSQVTLERVVGITASGNSSLTCDPCSGTVAYPAGCVVVLLNPSKNSKEHLINSSRKTITAVSFSSDGKYLVTGESGHLPAVRVWDVECGTQVAELQEHKYGVSCVTFSPNTKYIVSVGSQHDMSVNLWVWKRNTLVATNKVSSNVTAVAFSDDSSYFVTAGNRHVRFWYLEPSRSNKLSSTVPLMGRSGLLGELQNNFFCDVACGRGLKSDSTFCVTSSGLLCEFNDRRVLEKWVHLQTTSAASLSVSGDLIFCACANGTLRVFSSSDLSFICTLPRPHHLGVHITTVTQTRNPDFQYPDSVAVTYDHVNGWLSCVYDDHSLYIWDTRDLQRVLKVHSALYHSDGVWDLQMFPKDTHDSRSLPGSSGMFFSCSSDSTVRLWRSDNIFNTSSSNLFSRDLHEVIYMNDNSDALLDVEGTAVSSSEKTDGLSSERRNAVRSICVSPDGRHLASGDRSGILRVHDLTCLKEILKADVHDSEIVCLEYSKPHTGMNLLVTASRDRLIHVLDVDKDYSLLQTLDEHSSSVTAVHFTVSDGEVKLISCGADKSLYFHTAYRTTRGTEFLRTRHVVHKTTFCDMTIDPSGRYAVVGCQDRSVRVLNISSGKQKKSYKGSERDEGHVLKIEMDPSGVYVAVSCSDKTISLFDFRTGECLATMFGHSEIIGSLMFTDDCKYLISASGDSCIFVWRLAPELTMNMRERLFQRKRRQTVQNTSFRRSSGFTLNVTSCYPESERDEEEEDEEHESHQKSCQHQSERSVEEEPRACVEWNTVKDCEVPPQPRRRWSSRVGSLELMVKSMLELRQLDSLSKGRSLNRDFTGGLQQRSSTSSLKDGSKKQRVRPHSAWLAPASTPEPEGVVLYSEEWPNRITSQHLHTPAEVCHSLSSGFCVGYCSAEAGPDQHQHDSDERSDGNHTDRQQISQDVSRKHQMVSGRSEAGIQNRPEGASTSFHAQRTSAATTRPPIDKNYSGSSVQDVREPVMRSSPQRNHPYLSQRIKHPVALQKSASVHNLSTDARRSLTPTRVRREVLKTESRAPPHHMTESWECPNLKRISRAHSYMSPTTSSTAKISRSVSIGDLKSTSCESLCSSTTNPGEGKPSFKAAVCPRMSSPFAEWPSKGASTHFHKDSSGKYTSTDLGSVRTAGDPEAVTNHHHMFSDAPQRERPQVAVKAFSVQSDAPAVQEVSVSLEECRRAAAELRTSLQRSTQLYRTLLSSSAEGCVQQQKILWDALLSVGSELDSLRASGVGMMMMMTEEDGKMPLTLLEQYSELQLQSVEKRLQHNM